MRCASVGWDLNGCDGGGGQAEANGYLAVPHLTGTKEYILLGPHACAQVTIHMASRSSLKMGQGVQSASSRNRTGMHRWWAWKVTAWDPNNCKQPPPSCPAWINLHHP